MFNFSIDVAVIQAAVDQLRTTFATTLAIAADQLIALGTPPRAAYDAAHPIARGIFQLARLVKDRRADRMVVWDSDAARALYLSSLLTDVKQHQPRMVGDLLTRIENADELDATLCEMVIAEFTRTHGRRVKMLPRTHVERFDMVFGGPITRVEVKCLRKEGNANRQSVIDAVLAVVEQISDEIGHNLKLTVKARFALRSDHVQRIDAYLRELRGGTPKPLPGISLKLEETWKRDRVEFVPFDDAAQARSPHEAHAVATSKIVTALRSPSRDSAASLKIDHVEHGKGLLFRNPRMVEVIDPEGRDARSSARRMLRKANLQLGSGRPSIVFLGSNDFTEELAEWLAHSDELAKHAHISAVALFDVRLIRVPPAGRPFLPARIVRNNHAALPDVGSILIPH
jgi:hypothetical protein